MLPAEQGFEVLSLFAGGAHDQGAYGFLGVLFGVLGQQVGHVSNRKKLTPPKPNLRCTVIFPISPERRETDASSRAVAVVSNW